MSRGGRDTPWQCALRYLGFRSRTESEMRRKLMASGFSEQQVESTLDELKIRNLVNDEELAHDWARRKAVERGYGPLLVQRELGRRGVPETIIEHVLVENFGGGREVELVTELVGRNFGGMNLADAKMLKRAESLLLRKGYHPSVISDVLGEDVQEC